MDAIHLVDGISRSLVVETAGLLRGRDIAVDIFSSLLSSIELVSKADAGPSYHEVLRGLGLRGAVGRRALRRRLDEFDGRGFEYRDVLLLRGTHDASAEFLRLPCPRWRLAVGLKAIMVANQPLLCLCDWSPRDHLLLLFKDLLLALMINLHLYSSRARMLQVSLLKPLSFALHHVRRAFFPSVSLVAKLRYRYAPKHLVCLLVYYDSLQAVFHRCGHHWLVSGHRWRALSVRCALSFKSLVEEAFNAFFLLVIELGHFVVLLHRFCLEV